MVKNLINRNLLVDKSPAEMEQLLDRPSSWGPDREYCAYVVKIGGAGFNKVYILQIDFQPTSKKVASVRVRGD